MESGEGNSVGVGKVSVTRIDIYPMERYSIILGLGWSVAVDDRIACDAGKWQGIIKKAALPASPLHEGLQAVRLPQQQLRWLMARAITGSLITVPRYQVNRSFSSKTLTARWGLLPFAGIVLSMKTANLLATVSNHAHFQLKLIKVQVLHYSPTCHRNGWRRKEIWSSAFCKSLFLVILVG